MIEFDPIKHLAISHAFGGGMYIKQCELPVGFTFAQHRHNFDHLSILASGKAIVEVDGVETEFVKDGVINSDNIDKTLIAQ